MNLFSAGLTRGDQSSCTGLGQDLPRGISLHSFTPSPFRPGVPVLFEEELG